MYCIANVYAHNIDRPDYFNGVFGKMKEMDCIYNIVGGDFNVALNSEVDRNHNVIYHKLSRGAINEFMETDGYIDVWREHNPDKKQFTWRCNREWSRIDYFLVSQSIIINVGKVKLSQALTPITQW